MVDIFELVHTRNILYVCRYANRFGDLKLKNHRPNSNEHNKYRYRHNHGYHYGNGDRYDDDDESYNGNSYGEGFNDGVIDAESLTNRRHPATADKSTVKNKNSDTKKTIATNMHMFNFVLKVLLLAIKLKLLVLFNTVMFSKFLVFVKVVKMMLLPLFAVKGMMMMNMMTSIMANPNCTNENNNNNNSGNTNNTTTMKPEPKNRNQLSAYQSGSPLLPTTPMFSAPDRNDTTKLLDTTGLVQLVESIQSEPCVERMACLASVSGSTAVLESFWMNG